ncbi:MAG: hypothetical protein ACFFEV_10745 [Candidatus Thorarchaeota archaeon]
MEEAKRYINPYKSLFDETHDLSIGNLILGFIISTLILLGSTWGLLTLLNVSGVYSFEPSRFLPYTLYMLAAAVGSIILALNLCSILIRWPRTISLPLHIHRLAKRHAGDYFMSPEPEDENLNTAFRRSLYGSVLIVGIALTILGFELMANIDADGLIYIGTILMIVSVIILPFTVMLLYYGPWLLKESGLFHLDVKDRSLSNVGDDVEDILEFFAGVDIILVWIELTLSVGFTDPWVPIVIIIIALGPLFSIVLNFTIVFVFVKKRATMSMMHYLSTQYDVPDMISSPAYIRNQVLSLIEHQFFMSDQTATLETVAPSDIDPELELVIDHTDESGFNEPMEERDSIAEDDS